ncbi:AMP-binding protein [Actinoallomurus sp. CA-142502]|uniref:AMP-binding protein n=1 Tax=Actinoallomurus sp. CA-142502 TaxID=3239885 RepID=UPI003D90E454
MFSSGSTGTPRGYGFTTAQLEVVTGWYEQIYQVTPDSIIVTALPAAYNFTFVAGVLLAARLGARLHLSRALHQVLHDARELAVLADRVVILANPVVLEQADVTGPLPRNVLVDSGGAPLSTTAVMEYRDRGIDLREGYGLTETASLTHFDAVGGMFAAGTVGHGMPGVRTTLEPVADKPRIVLASPAIGVPLDPYEPEPTGLLRSTDVGAIDAEGRLRLLGRLDDEPIGGLWPRDTLDVLGPLLHRRCALVRHTDGQVIIKLLEVASDEYAAAIRHRAADALDVPLENVTVTSQHQRRLLHSVKLSRYDRRVTTPRTVEPGNTAIRPTWKQLPVALRAGLADRLGEIASADVQGGGFTPGLAARLQLADGQRVFAKGIPAEHPLAGKYRDEAATTRLLPPTAPAPRLRWDGDIGGWVVLVLDDVDARHADLSVGSADVPRVVPTIAGLADVLTPCPSADAPAAEVDLAGLVHGWRELAEAPPADLPEWPRRHLAALADLETWWLAAAAGDTLVHGDVNASNLLVNDAGVYLIDWAQPARGAAWLDVADLIPHLILAGHTPAGAEAAIADVPAWHGTDAKVITSYAAAFAGYWARVSRQPAPPGVPHLRGHQARAARAATAWVAYRTGWV